MEDLLRRLEVMKARPSDTVEIAKRVGATIATNVKAKTAAAVSAPQAREPEARPRKTMGTRRDSTEQRRDSFDFIGEERVPRVTEQIDHFLLDCLSALRAEISQVRGSDLVQNLVDGDTEPAKKHILYRTVLAVLQDLLRLKLGEGEWNGAFLYAIRQSVRSMLDRSVRINGEMYQWDCQMTRQLLDKECERLSSEHPTFHQEGAQANSTDRMESTGSSTSSDPVESVIEAEFIVHENEAGSSATVQPVNEAVKFLMQEFLFGSEDGVIRQVAIEPEAVIKFTNLSSEPPPPDAENDQMYRTWLYNQLLQYVGDWVGAIGTYLQSDEGQHKLASLDPPRRLIDDLEVIAVTAFSAAQVMVAYNQPIDGDHNKEIGDVIDRGDLNDALEIA